MRETHRSNPSIEFSHAHAIQHNDSEISFIAPNTSEQSKEKTSHGVTEYIIGLLSALISIGVI